ncbi:Protein hir1 [Neolecta irregularis DAH-3]|uniref:Protein HIR n=1 Tax=Neolecta irregularis (strain DAH-3) TaxID=1198029 RepID=A0A1U7LT87_NEOID|nr:Protein hir1 [Neolecta irregularis DAH-3]|eukprot:OLL25880.1 Protein hir1 [Neolecta irregularis DAH-3]
MFIIKPNWLSHQDDRETPLSIFSVSVHPDGSRIATGGLDGKVKIWSVAAMESEHENEGQPRQLCSMSTHNGAVHAVRFSPGGRFLASGSDDKIILIWERDTSGAGLGLSFGGDSTFENWRSVRRLAGHDNDIQDLAWSADSSLLVSAGLDSSIIVWHGHTFQQLKRIEGQSHVKGLTFDPSGKYFASASDDRTVKIWRTNDFALEKSISTPFENSPLTTYFRRLSWSPDGNNIACPNAMNGPVSSIAIVQRGEWSSDFSLIGHEGPAEIVCFNPRLFKQVQEDGTETLGSTIVVSAGQDKVVTFWNTTQSKPFLITEELGLKSVSDLTWSANGDKLFISSYDGSVALAVFEPGDLGFPQPWEDNIAALAKYGHGQHGMILPESVQQLELEALAQKAAAEATVKKMDTLMGGGEIEDTQMQDVMPIAAKPANSNSATAAPQAISQHVEKIVDKRVEQKVTVDSKGRKRVAPTLISNFQGSSTPARLPDSTPRPSAKVNGTTTEYSTPSNALPEGGVEGLIIGNKRKEQDEGDEITAAHRKKGKVTSAEEIPDWIRPAVTNPAIALSQTRLGAPKVKALITYTNDSTLVLEIRNSPNVQTPTRLICKREGETIWTDYIPRSVLTATGTKNFWAVATEDGSVYTWNIIGKRLFPVIVLESQSSILGSNGWWLFSITVAGLLYVWDMKMETAAHTPASLAPILDSATTFESTPKKTACITNVAVTNTGVVCITLTSADSFVYNGTMLVWQRVSEPWWAINSLYWDSTRLGIPGPLGSLERRTDMEFMKHGRGRAFQRMVKGGLRREGFEGLECIASLAHLENRISSAALIGSAEEYRSATLMYARRLGEQNFQEKVKGLCQELLGPQLFIENHHWKPTVVGIYKRELLKEVLEVMGGFREVQRITTEYSEALQAISEMS